MSVLAGTLWLVELAEIWRRLHQIEGGWLALTLAILLAQFVLLTIRFSMAP